MLTPEREKELDEYIHTLIKEKDPDIGIYKRLSLGETRVLECPKDLADGDVIKIRYDPKPDFYLRCNANRDGCIDILCFLYDETEESFSELKKLEPKDPEIEEIFEGLPTPEDVAYILLKLKEAEEI